MSSCIASSQNRQIVDAVLAIMQTMFTYISDANSKKLTRAFLTQLGFGGLPDYESLGVRLIYISRFICNDANVFIAVCCAGA